MSIEPMPLRRDDIDRHPPARIDTDLDRILSGLGSPPAPVMVRIAEVWDELVGPVAARHCRPGRVVDGRLHVVVDDAAWAAQLRWQATGIVARIAEVLPGAGVTEVRASVRPASSR